MFVVEIGAAFTTVLAIGNSNVFSWFWLWGTVVFANLAEAIAEGRGKAQAESLKKARTQTQARKIVSHER